MARLLTACVVVIVAISVYGFIAGDKMRLSQRMDKRYTTISVYMPNVTREYFWLTVIACSADIYEASADCNGYWDTTSGQEINNRKTISVEWRDLPRGTILVRAAAKDSSNVIKASSSLVFFR